MFSTRPKLVSVGSFAAEAATPIPANAVKARAAVSERPSVFLHILLLTDLILLTKDHTPDFFTVIPYIIIYNI